MRNGLSLANQPVFTKTEAKMVRTSRNNKPERGPETVQRLQVQGTKRGRTKKR